jgi:hypothetical protein
MGGGSQPLCSLCVMCVCCFVTWGTRQCVGALVGFEKMNRYGTEIITVAFFISG